MNMMAGSPSTTTPASIAPIPSQQPLVAMTLTPTSMVTGSSTTPIMGSPGVTKTFEVQPLTNVFVPLESIKPGEII